MKKTKKASFSLQRIATEARKTLKTRVVVSPKMYKRHNKHKNKPFADTREGFHFFRAILFGFAIN
ncbi:MAG: hypothetical protein EAZ97_08805 [Bacteroidetes bacterium]|nr:MAG: hypothetical protein EAZ97_08805 [Bacteroidota bacterium]